jgi:ankyrin repeat protein
VQSWEALERLGPKEKIRRLLAAAERGHLGGVLAQLEGPDPLPVDVRLPKSRTTALITAVKHGQLAVAQTLLARGADVNVRYGCCRATPLMVAARLGHQGLVALLLAKGASIEQRDNRFRTPFTLAAADGHLEVMRLLADELSKLDAQDTDRPQSLRALALKAWLQVRGGGGWCQSQLLKRRSSG